MKSVHEEHVVDRVCCGAKLRATACHALAHKLTLNIVYALQYHSVPSCILARPLRSGLGEGLPRPSLGVDCPAFVGERPRFPNNTLPTPTPNSWSSFLNLCLSQSSDANSGVEMVPLVQANYRRHVSTPPHQPHFVLFKGGLHEWTHPSTIS